jgi:hypothetical protein
MAIAFNGHKEYVGVVRVESFAGAQVIHVEALQRDGSFEPIEYGGHALYSKRSITEETARRAMLPRSFHACDEFRDSAVLSGWCEDCGFEAAKHQTLKALTAGPETVVDCSDDSTSFEDDDLPRCESCAEPVPDDETRIFCAGESVYFHRKCFGFDVDGAVERLRAEFAGPSDGGIDGPRAGQAESVETRESVEAAILVGVRDEHDMRLILAAIGWSESSNAWGRVMGEETEDDSDASGHGHAGCGRSG